MLTSWWLVLLALILTILIFILRIPAVKVTVSKSVPIKDASVMAVMVPKGLAAAVLASIPFQEGLSGGELIQNVTYAVILFSIVLTSLLLFFLDKTKLLDFYGWIFSPGMKKSTRPHHPKLRFASPLKSSPTKPYFMIWRHSSFPTQFTRKNLTVQPN